MTKRPTDTAPGDCSEGGVCMPVFCLLVVGSQRHIMTLSVLFAYVVGVRHTYEVTLDEGDVDYLELTVFVHVAAHHRVV